MKYKSAPGLKLKRQVVKRKKEVGLRKDYANNSANMVLNCRCLEKEKKFTATAVDVPAAFLLFFFFKATFKPALIIY